MEKKKFCKRVMLWTAITTAIVMLVLGLLFGKVVEANIWEEIGKWVVMAVVIIGILEVFAYVLAPFVWHTIYDGKDLDVD